jgi:uncharacterized membrane protein YfcA
MNLLHMDSLHIVLLLGAGIVGGTLSALIGGAAIITFPALLATGLNPVLATAANMVALTPGNFVAALYDRGQLPPFDRSFVWLVLASILGALAGAALLLVTPVRVFAALVPLLLGFATVLFACSGRMSAWLRARAAARGRPGITHWGSSIAALVPVSIYGGYFGGVMLLAVLSIGTDGDYRSANVTKNLVTSLNCVVVSAFFVAEGAVSWGPALVMMAGALVGALLGARLAQVLPNEIARSLVVAVGALLTGAFAWRYWF